MLAALLTTIELVTICRKVSATYGDCYITTCSNRISVSYVQVTRHPGVHRIQNIIGIIHRHFYRNILSSRKYYPTFIYLIFDRHILQRSKYVNICYLFSSRPLEERPGTPTVDEPGMGPPGYNGSDTVNYADTPPPGLLPTATTLPPSQHMHPPPQIPVRIICISIEIT